MEAEKEGWAVVSPDEAAWEEYLEIYLEDGPLRSSECIAMLL